MAGPRATRAPRKSQPAASQSSSSQHDDGYVTPSRSSQSAEPLPIRQLPHDALHPLDGRIREVISVISRLEALGLQNLSIPLPKCIVLGEQSSGKSSVIEAISGVRTPRAGGTCTRCPLFIKLERSNDNEPATWRAKVTLRYNYKFTGIAQQGTKLPGWTANLSVQEVPFASCRSEDELEEVIRRAQLALVHPLEDASIFAQGPTPTFLPDDTQAVNFTPNIVCIYVSSPTLPNLSFYDLPGLISQSETPGDVALVENLVQEYVQDKDALVIVACSLAADIATSYASGYARNKWGAGSRCIGVLTKPDLLPAGSSVEPLERVLNNTELKFGHGYFVVKNPDQLMLNDHVKHIEARKQEQLFFNTHQPWNTSLQAFGDRFGTLNLQEFLSKQLARDMIKALPNIHEQVQLRLDEIDAQLQLIPEPPSNYEAVRIIIDILNAFTIHIQREVEGSYPCKEWRNYWKNLREQFFQGLQAMNPTMMRRGQQDIGIYYTASIGITGKSADDPLCLSDGDEEMVDAYPVTPQNKRKLGQTSTPGSNKRGRLTEAPLPTPTKMKPVHGVDYNGKRRIFQLDDVSQHLKANSQSKMGGNTEPKVIEDLVRETIKHWKVPMEKLFLDLANGIRGFFHDVFDEHFKSRKDTKLYTAAWKILDNILTTSITEQRTMAADAFIDEWEGPYTFHEAMFNSEKAAMIKKYSDARFDTRLRIYMEEMEEAVGKEKVPNKDRLLKNQELCALLRQEPYAVEIGVVAQITSYYAVAVRRFHDSVCMRIESKFFTRLRTKLRDDVYDTLGFHNEDAIQRAMDLLAEPSHLAAERKRLTTKKISLVEGQRHLDALQVTHNGSSSSVTRGSDGFAPSP